MITVLLTVLILPLALELSVKMVLKYNKILVNYENNKYGYFWGLTHPHTFSDGTFSRSNNTWHKYGDFLLKNNLDDLKYIKKALILSDIYYNIEERPSNYLMRSKRLYQIGTQGGFFYGRLKGLSRHEQGKVNRFNSRWNTLFVAIYLMLLLLSTVYFVFSKHIASKSIVYVSLIFMSIIS